MKYQMNHLVLKPLSKLFGKSFFLAAAGLALAAILVVSVVHATSSDNISGYAWSPNIGVVSMNGAAYGANMQLTAPGTTTGAAWSSNIGWISFDAPALATDCPTGTNPCRQGYADWASATPTSVSLKGWARACSVFVSGCSGAMKPHTDRGGWDGYIALAKPSGSVDFGINLNPTTGAMSGYAWGSDVVGWLNFGGVTVAVPNTCVAPQVLVNGVCQDPVVCTAPQILVNGICQDPSNKTCTAPQVLVNGVCQDPSTSNCIAPQILVNGICQDPPVTCTAPQILINGVCQDPLVCVAPQVLVNGVCTTPLVCPAGSGQIINPRTNKCTCPTGQVLNAKGICVKPTYNEF